MDKFLCFITIGIFLSFSSFVLWTSSLFNKECLGCNLDINAYSKERLQVCIHIDFKEEQSDAELGLIISEIQQITKEVNTGVLLDSGSMIFNNFLAGVPVDTIIIYIPLEEIQFIIKAVEPFRKPAVIYD